MSTRRVIPIRFLDSGVYRSASGEHLRRLVRGYDQPLPKHLQGKMAERSKACDSSERVQKPIVCLIFRVSHQGNPGVGSNPTLVIIFAFSGA